MRAIERKVCALEQRLHQPRSDVPAVLNIRKGETPEQLAARYGINSLDGYVVIGETIQEDEWTALAKVQQSELVRDTSATMKARQ